MSIVNYRIVVGLPIYRAGRISRALKRSIRAHRRAIKQALPFQLFDPFARRKSFADASIALRREGVVDRRAQVAMRYVSLLQDPAVRYLPATGAP